MSDSVYPMTDLEALSFIRGMLAQEIQRCMEMQGTGEDKDTGFWSGEHEKFCAAYEWVRGLEDRLEDGA